MVQQWAQISLRPLLFLTCELLKKIKMRAKNIIKLLVLIVILFKVVAACSPACTNPLSFTESCEEEGVTTTDTTPSTPTTGYTFSASSVNVAENGGTGTYTVKLNTEPTATVNFAITSDNTSQITVSQAVSPLDREITPQHNRSP